MDRLAASDMGMAPERNVCFRPESGRNQAVSKTAANSHKRTFEEYLLNQDGSMFELTLSRSLTDTVRVGWV